MDTDAEKMHLQSIEEYVLDEEKIVTYCWLSKVLGVHVNLSKQLLSKFASDPSHGNDVFLTYLISGKLKDGTYSVLVVGQDKLEEAKLDFEFITSHHVYSVQKKKETPSANILYLANSEKVENEIAVSKQVGVIKCALSIQRAEDELSNLRLNALLKNAPSATVAPAKKAAPCTDKKVAEKKEEKETPESKKTEDKKTPDKKPKAAGGLAAMFAAQSSKSSSAAPSSTKTKAKPAAKKAGGINSFFCKVPKTESPPRDEAHKSCENKPTDEPMDVDVSAEDRKTGSLDVEDVKPEVETVSPPKTDKPKEQKASVLKSNGKTPKNKPKKNSKPKSSSKPEKARKRIRVIDSSEDDMFESEKEDSPELVDRNTPSPPPVHQFIDSDDDIIPSTPQPESGKKTRRKRKVVKDKSYMDEDGFIVTEKVTVYESYSESDSENKDSAKKSKDKPISEPSKTNEPTSKTSKEDKPASNKDSKKPAKKAVSPTKNKQSSLMSFFKKA